MIPNEYPNEPVENPMLPELLQRRRPLAPAGPGSRWTEWALGLLARHGRLEMRPQGPRMDFRLPGAPITVLRTRWERYAETISPRLELAIRPVFQQWVRTLHSHNAPVTVFMSKGSGAMTGVAGGQAASTSRTSSAASDGGTSAGASTRVELPIPMVGAVHRILREQSTERRRSIVTLEEAHRIHRLVVEERQRIEMRPQPTRQALNAVLSPRGVAKRTAVQANGSGGDVRLSNGRSVTAGAESWNAPANRWPGDAPQAAQAGVDLEQLTEQVIRLMDDRFTAHNERLGRLQ